MQKIEVKGVGRTGSTLLWLIVRDLINTFKVIPGVEIKDKRSVSVHSYSSIPLNTTCLVSYRDPRNTLLSRIRITKNLKTINTGLITKEDVLRELEENSTFTKQLREIHQLCKEFKDRVLLIKYESFHNNFDYLIDLLEQRFNIKVNKSVRQELKDRYSKDSIIKIQSTHDSFNKYDRETHIHGFHVSKSTVRWQELIPIELHSLVNSKLKPFILFYGYEL